MVRNPATTTSDGGTAVAGPLLTCGFCGENFVEDRGQAACQSCPLGAACAMMRCPRCGYENPREPTWLARLWTWLP